MNKYEWFFEFRAKLASIDPDDRQKAVDYYEELYADKQERGSSEAEILSEFGSPVEVATKLIDDGAGDFSVNIGARAEKARKTDGARREKAGKRREEDNITPVIALLCTLGFFLSGAVFGRWRTAWLAFLLIPLAASAVRAVIKRNPSHFAYPVFVTTVFLALGMYFGIWHPAWIMFVTIPFYYMIFPRKRSGSARVTAIVCGIIGVTAIAGILVYVVATSRVLTQSGYAFDKIDKTVAFSTEGKVIGEIEINSDVHSIIIEPGNGKDVTIGYVDLDGYEFVGSENDGKVAFSAIAPAVVFLDATPENEKFLLIKVPLYIDYQPKLTINCGTGAVSVSGETVAGKNAGYADITVDGHTGSVGIKNVTAKLVTVSESTGSVAIEAVTADSFNVKTSTGSIAMSGVVAPIVMAKATTGSVRFDGNTTKLSLTTSTGSVRFRSGASEIKVSTSTGSVKGEITGKESEYGIIVDHGSGSSNVSDKAGGDKSLKVSTSTGSVDIRFVGE